MYKLSQLFHKCAYEIQYKQAGDSVNYAFLEEGSTLYIFFEGSNSITDWVLNFWFFKKPYKDMKIPYKVHGGFLRCWKQVEDIIIRKITEKRPNDAYKYKYKQIISVGYSHGGGLCTFCHECVWYHRPDIRDNIFGYNFDGPRIYHGFKVKDELKERWENYYVIRNYRDIITHLPPWILCFTHVGNMIHLIPKGAWGYQFPKCIRSHYPDKINSALIEYENKLSIKSPEELLK